MEVRRPRISRLAGGFAKRRFGFVVILLRDVQAGQGRLAFTAWIQFAGFDKMPRGVIELILLQKGQAEISMRPSVRIILLHRAAQLSLCLAVLALPQ
jgi:hypothetical protein